MIIRTVGVVMLAFHAASLAAQGSITGTVYDSLRTHAPLANATVVLVERSRYATSDAHGKFQFDSVPDGRYTIGFMHASLDTLDLTAPSLAVNVVGGRPTTVTLYTPSAAAAYKAICRSKYEAETGIIIGRVRDVDSKAPLGDATVTTDWTEYALSGGHAVGHHVGAAAQTNRDGMYVMCGVPTNVPLDMRTALGGFTAGPTTLQLSERLIGRVDLAVSRKDSAARIVTVGDSSDINLAAPGTASLRGTVIVADGRTMRDVEVAVLGTSRTTRTDELGAFRIDHIPAGTRTVEVRSIGLEPLSVTMDFATNAVHDTTLSITHQAQALAKVAVKGAATLPSWMVRSGYEERRRMGMGSFITAEYIARFGFLNLGEALLTGRGVRIQWAGTIAFPMMLGVADVGGLLCVPNVWLDGAPFDISRDLNGRRVPDVERFDELQRIAPPGIIKGIEVYSGVTTPAQYDRSSFTGCGSIAIWTR